MVADMIYQTAQASVACFERDGRSTLLVFFSGICFVAGDFVPAFVAGVPDTRATRPTVHGSLVELLASAAGVAGVAVTAAAAVVCAAAAAVVGATDAELTGEGFILH